MEFSVRKLFNGDPRSQIPPALAPITPPLVELVTYWTGRVTPEGRALGIQREIGEQSELESPDEKNLVEKKSGVAT